MYIRAHSTQDYVLIYVCGLTISTLQMNEKEELMWLNCKYRSWMSLEQP